MSDSDTGEVLWREDKWWAASLTDYQLVLYADLDVELIPPEGPHTLVAARWRQTCDAVAHTTISMASPVLALHSM